MATSIVVSGSAESLSPKGTGPWLSGRPAESTPASADPRPVRRERPGQRGCERCDDACLDTFRRLAALREGTRERSRMRSSLVEAHLWLAERLAGTFRDRGAALEDLVQVASLALVQAVDRFRPDRGIPFGGFATPTISGCLKRYFRDNCWTLRVPRATKELLVELDTCAERMIQELGRPPTVHEVAERLGRGTDEVVVTMRSRDAFRPASLQAPLGCTAGPLNLEGVLGGIDRELELVELREFLRPTIEALPPTQRQILKLRFFDDLTQAQIASLIGCSQVQVSRTLTGILQHLRTRLLRDPQAAQPDRGTHGPRAGRGGRAHAGQRLTAGSPGA